jgi:alkylhydroperoxidase family enzyme
MLSVAPATVTLTAMPPAIHPRWKILAQPRVRPIVELPWYPPALAKTSVLLRHPWLFGALLPLRAGGLLRFRLRPLDRELLILRTGWNCGGYYEWGHHVNAGLLFGRDWAYIKRVARGPDAPGWQTREIVLLSAADELFHDQAISAATWKALAETLGGRSRVDACLLVGMYEAAAMMVRSLGVPFDGWSSLPLRLPPPPQADPPARPPAAAPRRVDTPPPGPGAPALSWFPLSPRARTLLQSHPWILPSGRLFARLVRGRLSFVGPDCDLVLRRTVVNCGTQAPWAKQEWSLRPAAGQTGPRTKALVRAADELHGDRFISAATWSELTGFFDERQLIELCFVVGAYRTLAMTLNTLDGPV